MYEHPFFKDVRLPIQKGARSDHTHLTRDMKDLLAKVAKNKPREQRVTGKDKKKKKKPTQASEQQR